MNDSNIISGDGVYKEVKTSAAEAEARTNSSFVVTNCDLIRVRYLLVYAKQPTSMRFPTTSSNREGIGLYRALNLSVFLFIFILLHKRNDNTLSFLGNLMN